MKIPSSNLGRTCCVQKLFPTFRTIFVHNMFSPGLSLEFSCIELEIQWTICRHNCGLVDAKIRASDKDLPVTQFKGFFLFFDVIGTKNASQFNPLNYIVPTYFRLILPKKRKNFTFFKVRTMYITQNFRILDKNWTKERMGMFYVCKNNDWILLEVQ